MVFYPINICSGEVLNTHERILLSTELSVLVVLGIPFERSRYMKLHIKLSIRLLISVGLLSIALCGGAIAQQSGLPINAAASVNGAIITNDMVEQGIKAAIAQGQKDSPELRRAVIEKLIEVLLLSQQAEKDGLANSEKANTQLMLIRQNYLADFELSTFMAQNLISEADVQVEYNKQVASLGPQGMNQRVQN